MTRAAGLLLGLLLAGCDGCEPKTASPAEPPPSLRVPLPDGWRATTFSGGLQVGPQGRVVLQLGQDLVVAVVAVGRG